MSRVQSFAWLAKKYGLNEDEVKDMDSRYKHADLDRSGQLDRDELKALLKATIARHMSDPQLDLYLKSQWHNVDKDGNGSVDFEEYLALYATMKLENKRAATTKAAGVTAPAGAAATAKAAGSAAAGAAVAAAASDKMKEDTPKTDKTKSKKKKKKKAQRTFSIDKSRYGQNYISNDIIWSIVRQHNSFLVRRDGVTFSTEPGNLRNEHTFRSSGLAQHRTVDVSAGNGGVMLTLRSTSAKKQRTPKHMSYSMVLKKDSRPAARRIAAELNKYRPDLKADALARMTRVKKSLGGVTKKTQKTKRARRTKG